MVFVKVDGWGKCQICGKIGHLRFGICGFHCAKIWRSQGKWKWDKNNPNLAKITCNDKVWYYKETRYE